MQSNEQLTKMKLEAKVKAFKTLAKKKGLKHFAEVIEYLMTKK